MSGIKQWYSAAELAAMKMPGLPSTDRNIREKADREGWPFRELKSRGRGGVKREYQPPKAVMKLIHSVALRQHLETAPVVAPESLPVSVAVKPEKPQQVVRAGGLIRRMRGDGDLTDKDRARRDAALILCRAIEAATVMAGCSVKRAIKELAPRILDGVASQELFDAAHITYVKPRAGGQTVSSLISRLQKMYAAYEQGRLSGNSVLYLVPGGRQKEGHSPLMIHAFLVHYCQPSRPPVMEAWRNSESWFSAHGIDRPAVDTFYRIEKELPVTIKYRGRMTGSEFRALLPYVARDVSMFKANDIWVGDGHSFKAKVQHPLHGQPFVPEVTVILDWVSRKIVGWSVDLAESTIAVSAAFRHAQQQTRARCLIYYSDNGSGQTGKHIDSPIFGTLARQGIAHETGIPGNPQGRGIIERLWQTTTIPLARSYPTCIWKGADKEVTRKMLVALNRKDGSGERLLPSWQQFIADLDACFNAYNLQHEHRELSGMTPEQAYQDRLDPNSIDLGITDHELSVMWMPEEIRTPQRGVVALFNNEYANKDLVHLLAEGEKVRVRFDIHNAERVWLYRLDGRYIGEAIWDAHKKAAFPKPYIEKKREERAAGKINRGLEIIEEARAELGQTIEGETLQPFVFDAPQPAPELVPFVHDDKTEAGETSYMDTVMWLYGSNSANGGEQDPEDEVAAG